MKNKKIWKFFQIFFVHLDVAVLDEAALSDGEGFGPHVGRRVVELDL